MAGRLYGSLPLIISHKSDAKIENSTEQRKITRSNVYKQTFNEGWKGSFGAGNKINQFLINRILSLRAAILVFMNDYRCCPNKEKIWCPNNSRSLATFENGGALKRSKRKWIILRFNIFIPTTTMYFPRFREKNRFQTVCQHHVDGFSHLWRWRSGMTFHKW